MGSAASKALSASVKKVSDDDLKAVFVAWPKEERQRLEDLLKKSDEAAVAEEAAAAAAIPVIKVAAPAPESAASTQASTPEKEAPRSARPEKLKELDATQTGKFHSAIRWGKTQPEIEAVVEGMGSGIALVDCAGAVDEKNGNTALHIASQNGHMALTRWLLEKGLADVNAQNFKGQSALHMSVAYDFYFQSKMLLEEFKADPDIKNGDGNKAIEGIDGDKVDAASWDCGLNILKAASDNKEELTLAFDRLMEDDPKGIDKADLGATGMKKKKMCPNNWDADRFKQVMQRVMSA